MNKIEIKFNRQLQGEKVIFELGINEFFGVRNGNGQIIMTLRADKIA